MAVGQIRKGRKKQENILVLDYKVISDVLLKPINDQNNWFKKKKYIKNMLILKLIKRIKFLFSSNFF